MHESRLIKPVWVLGIHQSNCPTTVTIVHAAATHAHERTWTTIKEWNSRKTVHPRRIILNTNFLNRDHIKAKLFDGNAKDKRTKFFMQNTSSWNISNWFYCFQKYFRKRDKNDRRHEKSSFMVNFMSFTNFFAADEIRCDHRFSLLLLRRFCGHIHKSRSTIQKTVFLLNECPVNMQTEDFSFFYQWYTKSDNWCGCITNHEILGIEFFFVIHYSKEMEQSIAAARSFFYLSISTVNLSEDARDTHTKRKRDGEKTQKPLWWISLGISMPSFTDLFFYMLEILSRKECKSK